MDSCGIKVIGKSLARIGQNAARILNLLLGDKKPNRHGQWSAAITVGVFVRQAAQDLAIILGATLPRPLPLDSNNCKE
jgi:hypothetical protein